MKQQTGKYVTTGDISIVALIVLVGILGIPFSMSDLFAYIDCINEVIFTDYKLVVFNLHCIKLKERKIHKLSLKFLILHCDIIKLVAYTKN